MASLNHSIDLLIIQTYLWLSVKSVGSLRRSLLASRGHTPYWVSILSLIECSSHRRVVGSFIGMLALVLHNFRRTSLVDIPRVLMAAAAFFAIYEKISFPYILLAGGILSILIYGFLV